MNAENPENPTLNAEDRALGYGELIRGNRNFRYLWFGQIVSLLGDWFNLIASTALVALFTESGTAIGGLFVVRMLAPFLISPIAGVVADRYNRKQILITTDILRAIVVLGFLLVRSAETVWLLYVLTAIQLAISGFFFPTRNAILPDIVPAEGLGAANAVSSATWSTMLAIGAAIGGLVSGIWGSDVAFIIDALTFVLSAWLIAQVRLETKPVLASSEKTVGAALRQYMAGIDYLKGDRDVLVIALHKAAQSLFLMAGFQVVQVTISEKVFVYGEGGALSLGAMYAVAGIGTGIGPIAARYFTGDRANQLRYAIVVGYALAIAGVALTALLISFGWVLAGIALRGIGGGIVWVFSTQLLLQLVPGQVRGRIFATEFAFFTLASAFGSAAAGWTLESFLGLQGSLWLMAAVTAIPMVLWMAWIKLHQATQTETPLPEASN